MFEPPSASPEPISHASGDAARAPRPPVNADERWKFLRDVAVFEFKMFLDNVRDFFLMPASLVAAIIDLIFRGEREGERFYKVLEWGRRSESIINVYGELDEDEPHLKEKFSVDTIISQLETVIVREYEKGGTAATVKAAVDRAIDQLQDQAGRRKSKAEDAVKAAAEAFRKRQETEPRANNPSTPEPPKV